MPAEARDATKHPLLLWTGWVLGPVAWALHLMVSYLLVQWVCRTGHEWALHGVTAATFLVALVGVLVAWRQWSLVGRRWAGLGGSAVERTRFLAAGGVIISALSAAVILAEEIANLILSPCL